jgi:integrase/recombinase XerD
VAHLSPATRARRQATLTRFLTWAYRHDLVAANPMEKVDRVKREPPLPRGVGRENVDRILAVVPSDQKRDRLLFRLILETGLRVGEVLALHVEDLVLTAGEERLHVRRRTDAADRCATNRCRSAGRATARRWGSHARCTSSATRMRRNW